MSCHVMSCHAMSFQISCRVISNVMSCHVMSCHFKCHVISNVMSFYFKCRVTSCHVMSCAVLILQYVNPQLVQRRVVGSLRCAKKKRLTWLRYSNPIFNNGFESLARVTPHLSYHGQKYSTKAFFSGAAASLTILHCGLISQNLKQRATRQLKTAHGQGGYLTRASDPEKLQKKSHERAPLRPRGTESAVIVLKSRRVLQ